jgi:hypothetical protein
MNRKIFLYVAGSLMFFIGLLRGLGGLFSLTKGMETIVNVNIASWKTTVASADLFTVALLLIVSACLLFVRRNKAAWIFSWISIGLFIIGGLVNGFLLFGKPQIDGQIVNWSVSILIGLFLLFGKNSLKEKE